MTVARTRIKFCGVTRVEDALAAAALGIDALGVVLTGRSKRFAGIERAREIRQALPPFVALVALFMDDAPDFIAAALAAVRPDWLQFHGAEPEPDCARYGVPYLKAVAMAHGAPLRDMRREFASARGFVLDGHAAGESGGSGRTFDWSQARSEWGRPIVLAGGLTANNVATAIRTARPYAVDVSSGIEAAPGIKDLAAMRAFVAEVRAADREAGHSVAAG